MTIFHADETVTLHQGDVRDVLREMPAESVQMAVTSPPYWSLRDYGIAPTVWGGDSEHIHDWEPEMRQAERYTGKTKWQHIGEEAAAAGVKVRDVNPNAWGHPQKSDTAGCSCGAWMGCLGLEPTPEMFVAHTVEVFREVKRVLAKDGTLWLNIGDSYANDGKWGGSTGGKHAEGLHGNTSIGRERVVTGLKPKDLVGIPWMLAFALRADGWWLRQDIIWHKPNPMPESVTDRCTKAHEYLFLLAKGQRYFYDADAIREPHSDAVMAANERAQARIPEGGKQHIFEKGKFNQAQFNRPEGHNLGIDNNAFLNPAGRNKRSVWSIPTAPYPKAHFATFPPALVEPCILAGSREGDVVLDPFVGSGTTAMVARKLGRRAIGIDMSAEYLGFAVERINDVQLPLMSGTGGDE